MKKLMLFSFVVLVFPSFAQLSDQIQSDRPGQANSANTVGKGMLQAQVGYNYNQYNSNYFLPYEQRQHTLGSLFRFGILEQTEVGIGASLGSYSQFVGDDKISDSQSNNEFSFSLRQNVLNGDHNLAFLAGISSPLEKNVYNEVPVNFTLQALSSHTLTDRFSLSTNLIYTYQDFIEQGNLSYVLNLGFSLSEQWSVFVENYGTFTNDNWEPQFDGGFAYLVNQNFQLDVSAGYSPIDERTRQYFIDFGLSYRIKDFWKRGSIK